MRSISRLALLALCLLAAGSMAQGISKEAARAFGAAADASALERIIRIGDPQLVRNYAAGLQMSRIETLPAAVEALVIEHFHDARVARELRDFEPRYRTRALFELHLERIRATIRGDEPSFRQVLRTDQPGIEDALLQVAPKFPVSGDASEAAYFLARRQHPGAVPLLIASIERSYQSRNAAHYQNRVISTLLAYRSVEAWRRASDEVERLRRDARITPEAFAAARKQLDASLDNPDVVLARMRRNELRLAFEAKRRAIEPGAAQIEALRLAEPQRYAALQAEFLRREEAIAAELGDEAVAYGVGHDYFMLGMFVRFTLGDARAAVPLLQKSAGFHDALGQVALADTYQLALREPGAAREAYAVALAEASLPTEGRPFRPYAGSAHDMNQFWREWLAAETEYARNGRPFRGRISERAIAGFFEVVIVHARLMEQYFPDIASAPPSRFALFAGLTPISNLGRDEISRQLARHDPSGFWTACVMGAVLYYGTGGERRRESAERSGVADLLPGLATPGNPNALRAAAERFMAARQLRVAAAKP